MGYLGRIAGRGYDAEAACVEGLGEGVAEAAFGAAGYQDCLGGGCGGSSFDNRHGWEDHCGGWETKWNEMECRSEKRGERGLMGDEEIASKEKNGSL